MELIKLRKELPKIFDLYVESETEFLNMTDLVYGVKEAKELGFDRFVTFPAIFTILGDHCIGYANCPKGRYKLEDMDIPQFDCIELVTDYFCSTVFKIDNEDEYQDWKELDCVKENSNFIFLEDTISYPLYALYSPFGEKRGYLIMNDSKETREFVSKGTEKGYFKFFVGHYPNKISKAMNDLLHEVDDILGDANLLIEGYNFIIPSHFADKMVSSGKVNLREMAYDCGDLLNKIIFIKKAIKEAGTKED